MPSPELQQRYETFVCGYLAQHPGSSFSQIAEGIKAQLNSRSIINETLKVLKASGKVDAITDDSKRPITVRYYLKPESLTKEEQTRAELVGAMTDLASRYAEGVKTLFATDPRAALVMFVNGLADTFYHALSASLEKPDFAPDMILMFSTMNLYGATAIIQKFQQIPNGKEIASNLEKEYRIARAKAEGWSESAINESIDSLPEKIRPLAKAFNGVFLQSFLEHPMKPKHFMEELQKRGSSGEKSKFWQQLEEQMGREVTYKELVELYSFMYV